MRESQGGNPIGKALVLWKTQGLNPVLNYYQIQTEIQIEHYCVLGFMKVGSLSELEEKYMEAIPDSYYINKTENLTCGLPRQDALHIFR